MKTVIINQPLAQVEPAGIKAFIVPLNIAESKLRLMVPNVKLEITDLEETFDLGQLAEFKSGQLIGWKGVPVF